MTRTRPRLVVVALVAILSGAVACDEASFTEPRVVRFTALPDDDATLLRAKFEPVAAYLTRTLGVPFEYVPAVRYEDSVDLFRAGDVQLAWFGGLSGVQARAAVPGARALAQGAADPAFYSYFVAHRDTGLTRSEDFPVGLRGRRFTFGAADSTSGRLMPEHFIRRATGLSPTAFFGHDNAYAESHDKTLERVMSGAFDAGAVNYKKYDRWVAEGKLDPEVCRVIWQTPVYADYNLTAHPDLDARFGEGFTERVRQAFLDMRDPELLAAFERERLVPASNDDYREIATLARELGFIRG